MIKAIVLDIDGVIVGDLEGVNFPNPNKKVATVLKKIHSKGIPVSFLTAKPAFAAAKNIKHIGIDNPHIADGGATIFNPMQDQIIHRVNIEEKDILHILDSLPDNTYINFFSIKDYYLKKELKNEFTYQYGKTVEQLPIFVDDMKTIAKTEPISKINIVAFNEEEKKRITKTIIDSKGFHSFNWSTHPFIAFAQVMVITAKGISKRSGVEFLAKYLDVSLENILGVGDTIQDWDFIEVCGYKAAMGNALKELKLKIDIKDPHQIIGGHVNENGIFDILNYFKIL